MKINRIFWRKKKVLITGCRGFLGSWLAKSLAPYAGRVIGVDKEAKSANGVLTRKDDVFHICGDIRNASFLKKIFSKHKPDYVFHLAAEAIVGRAHDDPMPCLESNIQGTWNILEAVRSHKKLQGLIVASSDKAYGCQKNLPLKENLPLRGVHPYDASKSCADLLTTMYYHTYRIPVCITRCGNVYGPGDVHYSRLVPGAMKALILNRPFIIRSDGKYVRDYIFVADITAAYIRLAEMMKKKNLYGEAFNFSDERPKSVKAFYRDIASIFKKKSAKVKILNIAEYEIKKQYLSNSKSRRRLGWRVGYRPHEALQITRDWYSDRLKSIK